MTDLLLCVLCFQEKYIAQGFRFDPDRECSGSVSAIETANSMISMVKRFNEIMVLKHVLYHAAVYVAFVKTLCTVFLLKLSTIIFIIFTARIY